VFCAWLTEDGFLKRHGGCDNAKGGHQKVVLEIDFNGSLWGYTEITIVPTSSELRTIHLHSRQCTIHSVTVGGHQADFVHHDALANISMGSSNEAHDCHRHPELKRKIYSALQESDEGELSVAIPKEVSLKQTSHSSLLCNEGATPEPSTPGVAQGQTLPEFSPIVVNIAYSLRSPVDGVEFVSPNDNHPYRVPHVYTTPSCPDAARCWVPCIDNLWEKCTWEFEFVVPRYLEELDDRDEFDNNELSPTIVVCSGELVEQVAHPYNSNKTIFLFSQAAPMSVQHIAFAAGPFHLYSIPTDASTDEAPGTSQPLMYALCLPGQESFLKTSTSFLRFSMSFYVSEFGSYPFNSHKLVFVDQLPAQRFDSASLSIISLDVLHGEDAIEQAMEARQTLSHALACQWVGINIVPKTCSDIWLVNGLALYITGLFMRKLFGNNDYRFKLKKDMQRVLEWDVGSMPPICQPQILDPPDAATLPFINLKAPLVLHILDRRLGKSGTSLGLSRVLPKLFLSAISGELQNNTLSTHAFLRMCRKVSGVDPRNFAEQWIYGSGCPSFGFSASFNRKKMAVEITMRQEAPAFKAMENNDLSKALMKPVSFFEGQMTIRIHEADGTPYEHVLDIRNPFKRYEVPFNTKYKRVRRNTKRYLARQAAAQAAAEGDAEAAEAIGMIDMGFGLEIWEKEQERENWKVADWTEEDEAVMSGATYEWIRMDADFEWIANIKFDQPDFMWVSQLQRDRDAVAQLEALHALAEKPTAIVSSTLTKTVLVSNYYYRIRCEAALALVTCAIRKLDFLGLFHLFKLFLRYCYDPEDANQDLFTHNYVPKPNNFSDLAEYFVRKSLITAVSRVRFENGKSPSVVRQFLIDQLRYNDNTSNPHSDGFYICTIISAAAYAAVSIAPPERGELLPSEIRSEQTAEDKELIKQSTAEVDRYRSMDRLIPSPHNIVTIAALEFYMTLGVANLIPAHPKVFFPLTREGHYTQVRLAAFDGLFLTKWYTPVIMRYIFLALLVQMGEMKTSLKDTESLLIEEDGNAPEKAKESKKSELDLMIKVLRKDREVGKNEALREFLMPIALAPDVDCEVRWCLLKLADLLIRPVEETPPSVKIHIPSTPISEAALQIPAVKVPVKPPRTVKSGGPPSRHPSIQLNVSTAKVKLPGSPRITSISEPSAPSPVTKKTVVFAQPALPPPSSKAKMKSGAKPPTNKSDSKPVAKPTQVPRAQASGMNLNDLKACRNALKKLQANKHALLFNQPVDPIRDNAPRYFDIIKEPMDLRTMGAKIEAGMYKDRFTFQADFHLMISNAKLYNAAGSYVHNEAIALETFFEKQWAIINKTLEAADKSHASQLAREQSPKSAAHPTSATQPSIKLPLPATKTAKESSAVHATTATSSKPTIRLKVGPQAKPSQPNASTHHQPSPPPPAQPRPKKQKQPQPVPVSEVDPPPPPYVDDGSHDILQEVLAIEREKDEERMRINLERDKMVSHSNSKRKKSETLDNDYDDILALATPAKKERSSPPTPKPAPVPAERPGSSMSITIPKVQVAKSTKKEKPSEQRPSAPPPPVDVPYKPSHKGKEKEVIPQPSSAVSSAPLKAKKPVVQATPLMEKKCKELLKTLQKMSEAAIFNRPVDPVLDGCPTYFDEIAHPMDFATMTQKLSDGQYVTMEDFKKDVDLIFSNCRQFNPPSTFPVKCADTIEKVFKKEWPKAMERKLSWTEKRGLQGLMSTLVKDPISWVFREPVDPVVLGIPTYFDVIPRKDARDLRTIRQKLDSDKYDTAEAFEADLELMIQNAIKFNSRKSEVGEIAVKVQSRIQELLDNFKSGGSKKRKDGDKGTPQPLKKVKIG
ncbi:Transcription initiation factor TFIID subunit 2, partial [Leucoagaricus sp. SymC.cos]